MSIPLITKNYEQEVAKESLPVIVEFFASWCPKCDMMNPIVERLAKKHQKDLAFRKVDIDLSPDTADTLGVDIVPTFLVYHKGTLLGYTTGVLPEAVLEHRISDILQPEN